MGGAWGRQEGFPQRRAQMVELVVAKNLERQMNSKTLELHLIMINDISDHF